MPYRNTVEFEVQGDLALFSDPVTRVGGEKSSYHIPTYEALKGILQSVYWKPTFIWVIDEVRIMNAVRTVTKGIRPFNYNGGNDLAYYTYLYNVRYQVRAHFVWNDNRPELAEDRNEHKHHNIAKRMIERGGRRETFLGTKECHGYVNECVYGEGDGYYDNIQAGEEVSYGYMYHGITYADEALLQEDEGKMTVRFWRPVMQEKGVIKFARPEECIVKRHIREMHVKAFGKEYENFIGLDEYLGEVV